MSVSRRTFLTSSATIGGALTLGLPSIVRALDAERARAERRDGAPLRILILGGTGFIGPYQVQYAIDRGHSVTLFNRGVTNATLFPNVPRLIGDRNLPDGHKALESGEWDVVIDNPTANPKWVRAAGIALRGRTRHYVYVSTISVFADVSSPIDESGPLLPAADIDAAFDASAYGRNKVRSEIEARALSDMPVWVPPAGRTAGFARVICAKAFAAGLTFRPLADTAAATLQWYHARPAAEQEKARAGLAPDRESAVLAAWHASGR